MIRFLAAFVFIAFLGGSSLKACSCSLVSTPGSCGNLAGTPVKGSMSFVGTVTGAEHAGVLESGARDLSPLAYYHFHVDEFIAGLEEVSKVDIVSSRGAVNAAPIFG